MFAIFVFSNLFDRNKLLQKLLEYLTDNIFYIKITYMYSGSINIVCALLLGGRRYFHLSFISFLIVHS